MATWRISRPRSPTSRTLGPGVARRADFVRAVPFALLFGVLAMVAPLTAPVLAQPEPGAVDLSGGVADHWATLNSPKADRAAKAA
ncbi:MAG: hypothetical protein JNL50_12610, partial [Phycisphaerae bacterium]|nr:hypothetical protein [Phycisphaerae bacterium]